MAQKKPKKNPVSAQKNLGLTFRKSEWLEAALFHPSYRNENRCKGVEDFDRLEFFGDAILNYVICRKLYQTFPEANEGVLSRLRSILVSRKILFRIARKLKLGKLIRVGKSLSRETDLSKTKILADCLEALLAAYYFDRGLAKAEAFILKIFAGYFDPKKLLRIDPNPKSTLQELAQKNWQRLPVYRSETTPAGIKTVITVKSNLKATSVAATRREAEEKAALLLIGKLRQDLARLPKKVSSDRKFRKIS